MVYIGAKHGAMEMALGGVTTMVDMYLFNLFRGEIYFSAALDDLMGVNFTKKRVDLEQSIFDKINKDVKHQLTAINNQLRKTKTAKEAKEIDHDESARVISKKAPLLNLPKDNNKQEKGSKEREGGRGKDKQKRKSRQDIRVQFIAEHAGPRSAIYEARQEGRVVIIAWNIDHPFYERFVVRSKDDKTLSTSVDFLIYSMATAELGMMNDDNIELIENFKAVMAMNLNTLLR